MIVKKIKEYSTSNTYSDDTVFSVCNTNTLYSILSKSYPSRFNKNDLDIENKTIYFDYKKILKITDSSSSDFHSEIQNQQLYNVKRIINNPKLVLLPKDANSFPNRIIIIDDKYASNKPQLVVLECKPNDTLSNSIKVASTYVKNDLNSFINNSNNPSKIAYIDPNIKYMENWFKTNNVDLPDTSNCITKEAKEVITGINDKKAFLYLYRSEDDKEPEIRNLYNLKADNTIYTIDKFVKFEVRDSKNIESSTRLPEYEKKYSSLIKDTIDKANKYVDMENAKFDGKTEEAIDKINEHSASKEALQSISESLEIKNKISSKKFTK